MAQANVSVMEGTGGGSVAPVKMATMRKRRSAEVCHM